jgi:hypothetical protein
MGRPLQYDRLRDNIVMTVISRRCEMNILVAGRVAYPVTRLVLRYIGRKATEGSKTERLSAALQLSPRVMTGSFLHENATGASPCGVAKDRP